VSVSKRKRMEENELKRFLKNEKRDFSYVVVSEDYICLAKNCLLNFAPSLINRILTDLNENQTEVESIDILIDGDVRVSEISELGSSARELFCKGENVTRTISCRKYPKSGRVYKYPKLLVAADSLAHYLFRNKSFEEKIKAYDKEIVLD
ncbi:MAG: hypothetical protein QXD13_01330, partial [Candidatus Pacearchaeota archaeon]